MTDSKPHTILRRQNPARLYLDEGNRHVLEAPQPFAQSLEWRLANRYWAKKGMVPFFDGSVPYVVNNSGWAPRAAAELVLAAGSTTTGQVSVIEVAAGTGIFARQVLDHVQMMSIRFGLDIYQRLTYVCTDGSEQAVKAWRERGQFQAHQGRVVTATADAESMDFSIVDTTTLIGVFSNYALDSLPAEVVRRDGGRLHLQASLHGDVSYFEQWIGLSIDQIRDHIKSQNPEDLDPLLPLVDVLEVSASFEPGEVPLSQEALVAAKTEIAMVNVGAITFLKTVLEHLNDDGFILINDYGPTTPDAFEKQSFIHRFGGTATCALNFPHLDRWFAGEGCRVLKPRDDEHRTIHTRLAVKGNSTTLYDVFERTFSDPRYVHADRVGAWTSTYVASNRVSEALEVFERHLEWCPTDWQQLAEAAQLMMQQFGQIDEALELANAARQLNPWSSTFVWNVYGSALYSKGLFDDAEQAWLVARSIFSDDPSTWLNFAFLYTVRGQLPDALGAIANGMACDKKGEIRSALLQKQAEILGLQSQRQTSQIDRHSRRHRTLNDALLPLEWQKYPE